MIEITATARKIRMAIDGRVIGLRVVGGEHKLTLGPRDRGTSPGQETLVIENPPEKPWFLDPFIGAELWGDASTLMLGDAKIADRIGYVGITLVPHWRDLLKAYHGNRSTMRE